VIIKFAGTWKKLKYNKEIKRRDKMCFCGCLKTQKSEEETHGE
jgi:hypothetical protein